MTAFKPASITDAEWNDPIALQLMLEFDGPLTPPTADDWDRPEWMREVAARIAELTA